MHGHSSHHRLTAPHAALTELLSTSPHGLTARACHPTQPLNPNPRQEHSIRKEETKRKRERASKKEREAAEKQQKREELLRLKALKRQELDKKLKLIQQVAGKADLHVADLDMEGDFDSNAHDRRMVSVLSPVRSQRRGSKRALGNRCLSEDESLGRSAARVLTAQRRKCLHGAQTRAEARDSFATRT